MGVAESREFGWGHRPGVGGVVSAALVMSLCWSGWLYAYDYRVPIRVQDENDLEELFIVGDLTDEERDQLLDIYRSPLDLNTATRDELYLLPVLTYDLVDAIIAYREQTPFSRSNDVVLVEGIDAAMYREFRAFVTVSRYSKKKKAAKELRGTVRLRAADEVGDSGERLPEAYLRAEARHISGWSGGALVLVRNSLDGLEYKEGVPGREIWSFDRDGNPKWEDETKTVPLLADQDDFQRYLLADGTGLRSAWPKVYAQYKTSRLSILAGSYTVGFGQRLVIDNTGRLNPHGFQPDLQATESWDGYSLTKRFFGLASAVRGQALGPFSLDATGFFSWWRHDSYQYHVSHDLGEFEEDRYETYKVLTPYTNSRVPGGRYYRSLSYQTLPEAWSELLGGANVTLQLFEGLRWGVTGYGSQTGFHLGDDSTVFARSSRYPQRDVFGAVGSDLSWRRGSFQAWGEVAVMDSSGVAGIVRGQYEVKEVTAELSYRHYGRDFDNPHSRGLNQPDQWYGSRDRGEEGIRGLVRYKPVRAVQLRLETDVWRSWEEESVDGELKLIAPWRMENYAKVDWRPTGWLQVGAFGQRTDRDLDAGGRDEIYYGGSESNRARGEKYSIGGNGSVELPFSSSLWLYYKASLYDAALEEGEFQRDHYGTVRFSTRPVRWLTLILRGKYLKGELASADDVSREHYLEGYVQLAVDVWRGLVGSGEPLELSMRGVLVHHLSKDGEGEERPDEWFWRVGADYRF